MPYEPQKKYLKEYKGKLGCSFDKQLLADFRAACKKLKIDQTPVIEKAMQEIIDKSSFIK